MKTEPLDLKHIDILYDLLHNMKIRLSEFSFANLYLFRKVHDYKVVTEDECVFITGKTHDGECYALPLCQHSEPDIDYMRVLLMEYGMIFPVSDKWLKYFPESEFEISRNENDSDYIYTVEKMATYSGRKLSKKRNLLKQFHAQHEFETQIISNDNIDKIKQLVESWQNEISLSKDETDYYSALEALDHFEQLRLDGYLYVIDGQPGGYVLGEKITEDTYALHFAKALTKYKGVYQFMYNELSKKICCATKYINFEQDLGLQSLRQAKSSYKPDHMGEKYRIKLKK